MTGCWKKTSILPYAMYYSNTVRIVCNFSSEKVTWVEIEISSIQAHEYEGGHKQL